MDHGINLQIQEVKDLVVEQAYEFTIVYALYLFFTKQKGCQVID